jgi:hypothetical protein
VCTVGFMKILFIFFNLLIRLKTVFIFQNRYYIYMIFYTIVVQLILFADQYFLNGSLVSIPSGILSISCKQPKNIDDMGKTNSVMLKVCSDGVVTCSTSIARVVWRIVAPVWTDLQKHPWRTFQKSFFAFPSFAHFLTTTCDLTFVSINSSHS